MSSLLHPIHSTRDKCRPKHQVLVLKCYPKYQKTVQEIKPNSSELSYLLYYASSRRSKLVKVGAYLEKKTASDVWRGKLGNVQVTLQILTAVIEKVPRDLSLYSRSILTILDSVLRSKDINMVEESIPTFEAYCKHVEASSLTADQSRAQQFLNLVELYSTFAAKSDASTVKQGDSVPVAIRWRTVGLRAIRASVGSDALAADSSRQLTIVMPVILDNLSLEDDNILSSGSLLRAQTSERLDNETARRRRTSIATVTTVDTTEANPATAVETTAAADKVAEDEVRLLAVRCLKQIFSIGIGSTRGQTRLATALTLRFIATKNSPTAPAQGPPHDNWATSLFEAIARWTPVQDRFIIVVTAMETLVRSPIVESVLEKQLVLATMIDWLLSSNINLIGLSVMDVLIGFIHHTLLLLQLGGRDSKIVPHHQQSDTLGFYREAKVAFDPSSVLLQPGRGREAAATEIKPSPVRQELLFRMQKCIAALSNHIYYTDQITDMMTAILARLKPSSQSEISTTAAAINDPAAATKAIADSASLQEDPSTDSFFSFTTARVTALKAVKEILIRANNRRTASGAAIEARSRVGIQVWEGTQWLLKDEDRNVRIAYIDALLTWLKLETNKNDRLLPKDGPRKMKSVKKVAGQNGEINVAKRAVSSASRKESKPARSTFLRLLHLAVYDSILDRAADEADILLFYLLLTRLVERLGVNALRTGLPMIMRLQETTLNEEVRMSTEAKAHVASLVHGYFWIVAETFDFEGSRAGHEINAEISRRKRFSIWFDKLKFPAVSIDNIHVTSGLTEKTTSYATESIGTMKPYFNVDDMVNEIATAYDNALVSPPTSPPSSPGRVFSVPTLGFGYGYGVAPGPRPSPEDQLPQRIKDEMCSGWTREACIAAVEKESAGSMTGSRTAASSVPRNHLHVNGTQPNDPVSGRDSPNVANVEAAPAFGVVNGLGGLQKQRRSSANGSAVPLTSTSSHESTMRVTDLKRALSEYNPSVRQTTPLRKVPSRSRRSTQSSGTDSLVSWNAADDQNVSTASVQKQGPPQTSGNAAAEDSTIRPKTPEAQQGAAEIGQGTFHDQATLSSATVDPRLGDDVPPVPKIPSSLNLPGTWPRDASPVRAAVAKSQQPLAQVEDTSASPASQRNASSTYASSSVREGRSAKRGLRPASNRFGGAATWSEKQQVQGHRIDLSSLLANIQSSSGTSNIEGPETANRESGGGGSNSSRLSRPPY